MKLQSQVYDVNEVIHESGQEEVFEPTSQYLLGVQRRHGLTLIGNAA